MAASYQSFFSLQTTTLPDNFMQSVVELQTQLECEECSSLVLIQQLNDLYVMAIDYYINHDQRKLQHFQRKLTTLLAHPKTLKTISNKTTTRDGERVKSLSTYSTSLKSEMTRFQAESMILVSSMLEGSGLKTITSEKMMKENIEKQEESLAKRMLQRGKSKSITTR